MPQAPRRGISSSPSFTASSPRHLPAPLSSFADLIGESFSIHVFGHIHGWNANFPFPSMFFAFFMDGNDVGAVKGPMKGAWGRRSSLWR
jgi:hypothetical protein